MNSNILFFVLFNLFFSTVQSDDIYSILQNILLKNTIWNEKLFLFYFFFEFDVLIREKVSFLFETHRE